MSSKNHTDIKVNISDEEFLVVALEAHKRNITFNEMVNEIIFNELKRLEQKEGEKDKI